MTCRPERIWNYQTYLALVLAPETLESVAVVVAECDIAAEDVSGALGVLETDAITEHGLPERETVAAWQGGRYRQLAVADILNAIVSGEATR